MNQTLLSLAHSLRADNTTLLTYLADLENHFATREAIVKAFVPENGRFARLRQQAQALLNQYPTPQERPPLFGVPIGVKDIFHVDGFPTQAGSSLPSHVLAGEEAASVTALKKAGALILGKTTTTEFAYFAPSPTVNPHNSAHTPGGSSSGSAAAVGATLSLLTLGTQTIGSVNRPAAFCGVVGYKPSHERISRAGVIPLSVSVDHVGLFTPTVADAEFVASLLCQAWQTSPPAPPRLTIGIPQGPYLDQTSIEGLSHFKATCDYLQASGFTLKYIPVMAHFSKIVARHQAIVAYDAAQTHAQWFAEFAHLYHPKTADLIQRGQAVTEETAEAGRNGRLTLRNHLQEHMQTHGIDLWLTPPALGPAPKGLDSTGDPIMNLPWTQSGLPTLTLPAGFNLAGLPMGLQLVGSWYGDERLFTHAKQIEEALQLL